MLRKYPFNFEVIKSSKHQSCAFENLWDPIIKHIYSLVQGCSISIANTLEILQFYTKSLISSDTEVSWKKSWYSLTTALRL